MYHFKEIAYNFLFFSIKKKTFDTINLNTISLLGEVRVNFDYFCSPLKRFGQDQKSRRHEMASFMNWFHYHYQNRPVVAAILPIFVCSLHKVYTFSLRREERRNLISQVHSATPPIAMVYG